MVNISSQDRCCKTPIKTIPPIIPKETRESFLASSSMLSCSGVRLSWTYDVVYQRKLKDMHSRPAHLLHHFKDDAKLCMPSDRDHHAGASPVPDQSTHIVHARSVRQSSRFLPAASTGITWIRDLSASFRFTSQAAFVNL